MSDSLIVDLVGAVDGVNQEFESPVRFVPGSFRLIWNGVVYSPTDPRKGWTEITDTRIQTAVAPRTDEKLQAFVIDADTSGLTSLEVVGSPFDPTGTYP